MSEQISIGECPWCEKRTDLCPDCKIRDHKSNNHTSTESRMIGINCFCPTPYNSPVLKDILTRGFDHLSAISSALQKIQQKESNEEEMIKKSAALSMDIRALNHVLHPGCEDAQKLFPEQDITDFLAILNEAYRNYDKRYSIEVGTIMNLLPETQIKLNKFVPRDYQRNLCRAFEEGKLKRFLVIWPRRAGKDICSLALLVRAALRRVGTYMYIFPEFSSGRRILWDAIDIQGNRVMHKYIPEEIVESRNEQQMRIRLINGSQILVVGSDNYDSTLVGTNAHGMIFSEFALQDPRAWQFAIPILNASNGFAMFISTPRSKNHLWELYQVALNTPTWFCEKLTIDDTRHIPLEEIQREIKEGQISEAMAQQEYWTSFQLGASGAFYSFDIDNLRRKGQISLVPWEPYHPVNTAWDLGYNDPTTIIFFQIIGQTIRIIDCYENNKKGLDHYAKIVLEKPYTYGKHLAPFDIAVHDLALAFHVGKLCMILGSLLYAIQRSSLL